MTGVIFGIWGFLPMAPTMTCKSSRRSCKQTNKQRVEIHLWWKINNKSKGKMKWKGKLCTHTYKMNHAGWNRIPTAIEQKFPMQKTLSRTMKLGVCYVCSAWVRMFLYVCVRWLYTALAACVNQQNCIELPGQTNTFGAKQRIPSPPTLLINKINCEITKLIL